MHPIAICANHRRRGVLRAIVLEGSPIFAAWTMIQYGWEVVEGSRKLCTPSRSAGCSATCSLKPRRRKGGLTGAFLRGRMAHHDLRVVRRRQRELQEGVALHEPEGRVRVPAAPSVRSRVHRTCPEQTVSHRANRFSPSPPSMTSRMSSGGGEGGGNTRVRRAVWPPQGARGLFAPPAALPAAATYGTLGTIGEKSCTWPTMVSAYSCSRDSP